MVPLTPTPTLSPEGRVGVGVRVYNGSIANQKFLICDTLIIAFSVF
jgi:hypothetical protein